MIRLLLLALGLGFGCYVGASAAEPTFADLPTEEFVLVDGRKLVGKYDEDHGLLWLIGPANARLGLRPSDIAKRRQLAPGEKPSLPSTPLPTIARSNGPAMVSPAIMLAAKRDEVAGLAYRERDLARLVGEQEDRREHFHLALKLLNERIRALREKLLIMPDPNLGIESLRSFQVRESFGEIMQCAKSLRNCEDRLILLRASHAEAFLALSRGQAELNALERGEDATARHAASATPVDPSAWRIHELETKFEALQREHERLRREYDDLRKRQPQVSPAPPERVQPNDRGPTDAHSETRLAQAPGG